MNILKPAAPSFFVVGYPRSGTTLLASLLNRHSCISIPPETQFFRVFLEDEDVSLCHTVDDILEFYCNYPRIIDMGLKPEDFLQYRDFISRDTTNLLSASLEVFAKKQGKKIVGEKSPAHLLYWKTIIRSYPDAKIICIVRDGRDCILSNVKQKWTSQNPYKHAAEWGAYTREYARLSSMHPDKVILIKFEELLHSTEKVLDGVCDFIGCCYEETQLDSQGDDSTVPAWEKKWKKGASGAPDASRVLAWKEAGDDVEMKRLSYIMKNSLKKLGYETGGNLTLMEWVRLFVTEGIYFEGLYPVAKQINSLITKKH